MMTGRGFFRLAACAAILAAAALLPAARLHAQVEKAEAPFGDAVSERIPMYHRAAPGVGTAARLGRLGLIEAKAVGFRSVLSLAPSPAARADERKMADYVILRYFNVPVAEPLPTPEQVGEIRRILEEPDNAPILLHGERDQAAAAWALVRAAAGVPPEIALQEGLTAGLRDRLAALRERLGLGAPAQR